jgi:hypothetical protein
MSGRFIVLVIVAIGWLFAALCAYVVIYLFGFFGVGVLGLFVLFICAQVELESDGSAGLFGAQAQARQYMSRAERASQHHQRSLEIESARFFRYFGIGLTAIGFGGFLFFQLD